MFPLKEVEVTSQLFLKVLFILHSLNGKRKHLILFFLVTILKGEFNVPAQRRPVSREVTRNKWL